MNGNKINFDDKKIEKSGFYKKKTPFQLVDIDVNEILVSKKEPYGTHNALKYFIGYNDNDIIRPLCLRLSKMAGNINKFMEDKSKKNEFKENIKMSLRVNDEQLFKKYNQIWKKVEKLMSIDFESKPTYGYDNKYIKTKVKIRASSMTTNFHKKKKKCQKKKYHVNVYQ